MDTNLKFENVDQYIDSFESGTAEKLRRIRELVKKISPESVESISYQMPAFKLNGKPLVYFAAFKKHIGFYPTPSGLKEFGKELESYKSAKGSVQFPLDNPLPFDLIKKIIEVRMEQILNSNQ